MLESWSTTDIPIDSLAVAVDSGASESSESVASEATGAVQASILDAYRRAEHQEPEDLYGAIEEDVSATEP